MKFSKPRPKPGIIAGLVLISLLLSYLLNVTSLFQTVELKTLDLRFSMRGPLPLKNSPIVILAIDNQSDLSTPYRWPWPRAYFAHVIENLEKAGARAIGIDVIFDQPDHYNPQNDDSLAHVLARYSNVVLAGKIRQSSGAFTSVEILPPYAKFLTPNTHWGVATLESDVDGFFRRYPFLVHAIDTTLASFSAAILQSYLSSKGEKSLALRDSSDFFWIGKHAIPKYDRATMLINFYGPAYSFTYYSFDNVLDDQQTDLVEDYDIDAFDDPGDSTLGIPPGLLYSGALKDKIVLIGSTLPELHDNFPTPFLESQTREGKTARVQMPGVEIHANVLQTIIDANFIHVPSAFVVLLLNLFLVGFVLLVVRKFNTLLSLLITFLLISLYIGLGFYLFAHNQLFLPIVLPSLVVLFGFLTQTSYSFFLTQQEKKLVRGVFAHYVPEKVVQEIIEHPERLTLGGEERVVTVLFSDIAGFTTLSEKMTPKELVAQLNEYLTAMTEIILKHNGIIDKFEGDAIMAEFGMPVSFPNHEKAACLAALEMQTRLRELRYKWKKEGRPELHARIGINTGEMIVGNMGSHTVFDYTVIGDHVNLGARLEGANKAYQTNIMVSNFTQEAVKDDFIFRPLDLIRVKGKSKPVQVFELIGTPEMKFTSQFLEMLDLFSQGLIAYRLQQWEKALEIFGQCQKLVPTDKPTEIYINRCKYLAQNPPPDDWDGVWELKEK